jgi:hypothetical protein
MCIGAGNGGMLIVGEQRKGVTYPATRLETGFDRSTWEIAYSSFGFRAEAAIWAAAWTVCSKNMVAAGSIALPRVAVSRLAQVAILICSSFPFSGSNVGGDGGGGSTIRGRDCRALTTVVQGRWG